MTYNPDDPELARRRRDFPPYHIVLSTTQTVSSETKEIQVNGQKWPIVFRPNTIAIGCSTISVAALRYLLEKYDSAYGACPESVTLQ